MLINTNYLALVAQNNLMKSQSSQATAIQRLSSGLRINSAKDDAAGQAIANRMTAQINGLRQAARNASDGISLAQTTEGALDEINNNLQRIRELTVQGLSDTNSASDVASIQAEIEQRLEEINRISNQAKFNGIPVLASTQALNIQAGANANETIEISLQAMNTTSLGLKDFSIIKQVTSTEKTTTTGQVTTSHAANVIAPGSPISMTLTSFLSVVDPLFQGTTISSVEMRKDSISGQYYIQVGYQDGAVGYYQAGFNPSTADVLSVSTTPSAIANPSGAPTSGINTLVYDSNGDQYYIKNDDGSGSVNYYKADATKNTSTSVINVTGVNATATDLNGTTTTEIIETVEPMTPNPLSVLDKAIAEVDSLRSDLGTMQNRLESAISNLGNTATNLTAARSRIEDADYTTEVSNMTKAQILQQAGISILAQANQVPQNVLSLLR